MNNTVVLNTMITLSLIPDILIESHQHSRENSALGKWLMFTEKMNFADIYLLKNC